MPRNYIKKNLKLLADDEADRSGSDVLHSDDPRKYCHCHLLRRPIEECDTGKCKKIMGISEKPPKTKKYWEFPDLYTIDGVPSSQGVGAGNSWTHGKKYEA